MGLFSDEIRERKRKRRRREPPWSLVSFLLHGVFIALVILCTPAKELVIPDKQEKPQPAELTADRLEDLAETLTAARMNELLQQIQAMQAVLHNMDAMKEAIAKDYDAFAAHEAENAREALEKLVEETTANQAKSVEAQSVVKREIEALVRVETKDDLTKKETSEDIRQKRDKLMYETVEKTNTAQANAVNALDKLAVKAAFVGYEKTSEAAEKVREAQMEAAKMQDAAQTEVIDVAQEVAQIAGTAAQVARHEEAVRKAEEKAAKNKTRKAENEKTRAEAEAEVQPLEAELAKLREEKKWQEAKEIKAKVEPLKRQAKESQREVERAEREMQNAAREKERHEKQLKEAVARLEKLVAAKRERATEKQVERIVQAESAQRKLNEQTAILKATLAADASKLEKLAQEEKRKENALVNAQAEAMPISEAYELARKLEGEIAISYKDIKATQTAILKKMSFAAAQKITDVAVPERMKADEKALAENVRTQAALDRRKKAEAEVVREADNMVEATVAMMEDALKIVMGEDKSRQAAQKDKAVKWMDEKDFEKRADEESTAERLAKLDAAADYQVELQQAAAEDEHAKAKDLTGLMSESGAAAEAKNGAVSGPPELKGGELGLLPGNVMRVSADGKDGLEAKWMYVNSWYMIGPFPNPNRVNLRRKFAPESVQDLDATYVGKGGQKLRWRFCQAQSSKPPQPWMADWRAEVIPEDKDEYAIYYAYAEVFFDEACDRWVAIGSDDRSDVWLNDVPIWGSSNRLKQWQLAEDFRRVHFKKGRNKLLVRIENGHWNCGWSVCISTSDGR